MGVRVALLSKDFFAPPLSLAPDQVRGIATFPPQAGKIWISPLVHARPAVSDKISADTPSLARARVHLCS